MNLDHISLYIDKKIEENKFKIVFSFYELKIKSNLSNEELQTFLELATIRLRNLGYSVYYTGENYKYENEYKLVETNEMLIAIKK